MTASAYSAERSVYSLCKSILILFTSSTPRLCCCPVVSVLAGGRPPAANLDTKLLDLGYCWKMLDTAPMLSPSLTRIRYGQRLNSDDMEDTVLIINSINGSIEDIV